MNQIRKKRLYNILLVSLFSVSGISLILYSLNSNLDYFFTPTELKEVYKTVWEVSQKTVIDMSADRAPFIDQTQSMNLWLSTPTFGKVNSMHMYAWKKGLKTGMYYLRSRSAVDAVKVTVSSEKAAKDAYINTAIKQNNEPEDCETCSA